ncbi:alpha/beta hydrolase family protein [Oceanirhabdus seepicola]|uniref:S9 family peptidase n=1 Tax=Oceanirhabdus seepicola TaxID=2828781 RepID=A0A9J6NWL0_9CLOT|nr:S9 family peptidase [Oceanirhabdus seepicola]MCM1988643.1 S9 family peptidase [Oceanirhabdus seepicola]
MNCRNIIRQIPIEDFLRKPEKFYLKVSPDGNNISFLKPYEKRLNLHIQSIKEKEEVRITNSKDRDIAFYIWANDNRIVYMQDKGGDENYRLYAVELDGENFKELTPFDGVRAEILDELKCSNEEILILLNKRDKTLFDVYRINVNTGELKMVAKNPGGVTQWIVDHNGEVRAAACCDGTATKILYRESVEEEFHLVLESDFREHISPIFFSFDNKNIYISSSIGRDKSAIYEFNPRTKENIKLIFEHDEVDVDELLKSDFHKKIIGVKYYTDKEHIHFLDKERETIHSKIEGKLKGLSISYENMSKDESKMMIYAYSDINSGEYYLYDIKRDELIKICNLMPWLKEEEMCEMKPIKFEARDGLIIPGYLTLPKGVEPKNLPIVINPHGGPWYRDVWEFNPKAQFLANRGYGVLNVNFRGSTGYGRKFLEASFKQWGKDMQNDLTDGVNWLVNEGIANPERIAIYGRSYGGYATLAGVTFTPDLYACAVDEVGPSNLFTLLEDMPPYWESLRKMFYEKMGDPEEDKELLREVSPVFHVDKIKTPLFIVQGANDPRVPKDQSDGVVESLRNRGVEVKYMVKDNEGHGFHNEENIIEMFKEMESFLEEYL